jgi:protein TonB
MNLNSAALHQKRFFQNSLMMNDRCRFLFALVLGICINVILLFAGELFLRISKKDLHELKKTVSVVQIVLGKPIQENISSSQKNLDEIISETERANATNQNNEIEEEIFFTQKQNDEVFNQLVNEENVLMNSAASNFDEHNFSQSANNFETSAENDFFSSSQFSYEVEKNKLAEIIYALIEKEKDYPALARRRNIEGSVDVIINVTHDGKLKDEYISLSSGSTILDQSAINLIQNIFPLDINVQTEMELIITINYSLKD